MSDLRHRIRHIGGNTRLHSIALHHSNMGDEVYQAESLPSRLLSHIIAPTKESLQHLPTNLYGAESCGYTVHTVWRLRRFTAHVCLCGNGEPTVARCTLVR